MQKPFIQIDDITREMTDEEYAAYLQLEANGPQINDNETPTADA